MRICIYIWLASMILCCAPAEHSDNVFDVQGHRGSKGHLPENSIAGFLQALEWGVNTLEMDVVITGDRQVLVSHEPYMSHRICLDSTGQTIDSLAAMQYNIYKMTYPEIRRFDCGSLKHPDHPKQKSAPGPKPLLQEVIQAVEARRLELKLPPVQYNIEPKSNPGYDGVYHPSPDEYVALVLGVIEPENIFDRTIIQSFDVRILQQVKEQAPRMKTALLVENQLGPLTNLILLDFVPDIYSPNHQLVDDSLINYLHERAIKVIPWTVNDSTLMHRYIQMGVDGIITDYPDVLLHLLGRLPSHPTNTVTVDTLSNM